jgi:ADP-ribose pyrophosphatase YjhB (NUDIX family)
MLSLNDKKEIYRPYCTSCSFIFYQNPAVGVAVILIRDKKVLLGKRKVSYRGRWCIPSGYVEWDEDVYEAARREFEEETGLKIDISAVYAVLSNFHNPDKHTVGIWFLAKEIEGELVAADDIEEVGFFSYDELPILAFPTDEIVLRKLKSEQLIS